MALLLPRYDLFSPVLSAYVEEAQKMHVIKHVRLLGVLSVEALCATLPSHLSVPFCSVTGPLFL